MGGEESAVSRLRLLPPGPDNPRNSEGDFVQLKDGRILFVYSHFTGKEGADHSTAHLAGRYSADRGQTWTREDVTILPNEGGQNVMSVSLLRLRGGAIALFYCRKNSLTDCRPYMRLSTDEARTWGEPTPVISDEVSYYVLNNDRVVQLAGGRLIVPVCLHARPGDKDFDFRGEMTCYLSDDEGRTWRRSKGGLMTAMRDGKRVTVQEPGVVELKGGRLMMFCRSDAGTQQVSYSDDGGETWSPLAPSNIVSPLSPASIERIPSTGDLLLVWNDGADPRCQGQRRPFSAAISKDEGKTWGNIKTLDYDPNGWYCYTAVEFIGDQVLLGHCAGDRRHNGLAVTQITRFGVDWLYGK